MVYFAESRSKLKLTLGKIGRRLTHREPMKDHLILWKNLVEKSWSLHLLPTAAWCGRTVPLVGQGRVPPTSGCCRPSSTTLRREWGGLGRRSAGGAARRWPGRRCLGCSSDPAASLVRAASPEKASSEWVGRGKGNGVNLSFQLPLQFKRVKYGVRSSSK